MIREQSLLTTSRPRPQLRCRPQRCKVASGVAGREAGSDSSVLAQTVTGNRKMSDSSLTKEFSSRVLLLKSF